MAPESESSKAKFSLYADLLAPSSSAPGTISGAPVSYMKKGDTSTPDHEDAAKKQQVLAASLRFQPAKRPQIAAQKAKAKAVANKYSNPQISLPSGPPPPPPPPPPVSSRSETDQYGVAYPTGLQPPPPAQNSIADWTTSRSDDENLHLYGGEKRQRGGRKKRKKNQGNREVVQDWDDIYDPSRPNNYEDYKHSEEKIREVREWKDRLYSHRMRQRSLSAYSSDESTARRKRPMNNQFAPPPNLNGRPSSPPPPPPPAYPIDLSNDSTGEDAYARRAQLSQTGPSNPPKPILDASLPPSTSSPRPTEPSAQISRAPVRYSLPPPPPDIPATDAELEAAIAEEGGEEEGDVDLPRSNRPGQKGFAERLMSKYGWTKGEGLGAQGTGIINPLYAKADKRKKKSDAEGGGFVTPATTGKIMGGQKSKAGQQEAEGKFGSMSEVVKLGGMLKGMDLESELALAEGGIVQEIGEECGDKYGKVERVYIAGLATGYDSEKGPAVLVKFVSQLSALRAVNALEGRIFNGNVITARFWSTSKFDAGFYE